MVDVCTRRDMGKNIQVYIYIYIYIDIYIYMRYSEMYLCVFSCCGLCDSGMYK